MISTYRERTHGDEGFTLAEVVIAAFILFFVLTAMVGLIGTSQRMTVTAKDRSALTNAVAMYIDSVRSLDYQLIATPPTGVVKSVETTTIAGYTFKFNSRVVIPPGDAGRFMKTVYVSAQTTVRGRTLRTSAVVNIRNPRNDTTAERIVDPDLPIIEFLGDTPDDNAIVYGGTVWGSGASLRVSVDARSPSDEITNLKCYIGNTILRATDGRLADNSWMPGFASVSDNWGWNTLETGTRDGLQKVVIQAVDSMGREGLIERQFIIDNVAPERPKVPSVTVKTSRSASWMLRDAAPDPIPVEGEAAPSYASRYVTRLAKAPTTSVTTGTAYSTMNTAEILAGTSDVDAMFNAGPISGNMTLDSFSRYYLSIRGRSPRGLQSAETWSKQFISPPEVLSTGEATSTCLTAYRKKGNGDLYTQYTMVIYTTKPTFPISTSYGATSIRMQVKPSNVANATWQDAVFQSTDSLTTQVYGNAWKHSITWTDLKQPVPYWFRFAIKVTPLGWSDGTEAGYLYSNAVGKAPLDPSGRPGTDVQAQIFPDTAWAQ